MASLPPRQQSQRRASPSQSHAAGRRADNDPHNSDYRSEAQGATEDVSTVVEEPLLQESQAEPPRLQADGSSRTPDDEFKKCWICLESDADDPPNASEWRTPCPCALTAHESCLLEWIGDIEAPRSGRTVPAAKNIHCPQCKSIITVRRPQSHVVNVMNALESFLNSGMVVLTVCGATTTILLAARYHGIRTVHNLFGDDDAESILQMWRAMPSLLPLDQLGSLKHAYLDDIAAIMRRDNVFPALIPLALMTSATPYSSIALSMLPMVALSTSTQESLPEDLGNWPPSAAFAYAIFPYARSIYRECMDLTWGPVERGWMKEIRPDHGVSDAEREDQRDEEEEEEEEEEEDEEEGDENVLQLDIEIDVDGGEEEPAPEQQHGPHAPLEDDGLEHQREGLQREEAANRVRADERAARHAQWREEDAANRRAVQQIRADDQQRRPVTIQLQTVFQAVVSSLIFPAVAGYAGEALRLLLPRAWTTQKKAMPLTGLLQTTWGRSLVGACLTIVLKDAVRIYCRWRMVQSFRSRHVLNFDKRLGRVVLD